MPAPAETRSVAAALIPALLAWSAGCGPAEPPDPRPNVLLVTIDTLRADHLGSYGFPLDASPAIDALAERSVLFERAVAASIATVPSHASILTSLYPRQHSVGPLNGSTRLSDETTLAERFREAGWATAAFVGNYLLKRRIGLDRGFDVYDDELPDFESNRGVPERRAEHTNAAALAWLEAAAGPVFLWVHYQDPHGPYDPPPGFTGRFRVPPRPGEEPLPVLRGNSGWSGIPAYQAIGGLRLPSQYESRYADEIFYADRALAALLDAVDAHASGREAVVLLTADHGESLGENDRWFVHREHTTPDLAHVPMILRAPGIAPERRRELVSHVDVMPTLLELAGLEAPPGSGLALGPFLRAGRPLPERTVYCDSGGEISAFRGGSFVRVTGAEDWSPGAEGEREPLWIRHRWASDGSWQREPSSGPLPEAIRRYASDPAPLEPIQMLSEAHRERLRALGYAD